MVETGSTAYKAVASPQCLKTVMEPEEASESSSTVYGTVASPLMLLGQYSTFTCDASIRARKRVLTFTMRESAGADKFGH